MRRLLWFTLPFVVFAVQPWAFAAPGDLTLASTSTAGVNSNSNCFDAVISADGTKVAFTSQATNLDPADTDATDDVYVKDLVTGVVTLVSTSTSGTKGNGVSVAPVISGDGTKVAFFSAASNIDPADTDSSFDVFVKDIATGTLTLASTSTAGVKGDSTSVDPGLSFDGDLLVFSSNAANLDSGDLDVTSDVYVKDLTTGTLTLVSTSTLGVKGNQPSFMATISGDGSSVGFFSYAGNLHPADGDFIGDSYVKNLTTGALVLASTSTGGIKGNGDSQLPSLSTDASKVAFYSKATNLDPLDTDPNEDVYVKDLISGALTLASTSSDGTKSDSFSYFSTLSADGTTVAFTSSATNLDPGDTDATNDMYVKDLFSGTLTLASTNASGVKGNAMSTIRRGALDGDGTTLAFFTQSTNLDPADPDFFHDVYVKEVGGSPEPIDVSIKIKKSGPTYTVIVFTDQTFDASTVDAATVCFGDAEDAGQRDCTELDGAGQLLDGDRDGDLDMFLQFEAVQTGIDPGDTQACLTGKTSGGTPFEGCGAVKAR